jgi:DNA-binding transcriptional ArsR family regulator
VRLHDGQAAQDLRRLHLRAPTVTHHLAELRLSGLVNVTYKGQDKLYRTREESL